MHASGGIYQIGNAVVNGATALKKQLLTRAAKMLEAHPDDLEVKDRWINVKGSPDKGMTVADVTKDAIYNFEQDHNHLEAKGSFSPEDNPPPFGAAFADVEVDKETGEVKILKLVFVCDMGRAINPQTVEGQIEGGIVQGLGFALTEDYYINLQTGAMEADNFTTYKIPAVLDLPDIEVILYENPCSTGPFGAKGIGECSMVPIAPAIANAIYDAVGVRMTELPITPEKILVGLKNGRSSG
jgi:xanthine dehydrogenase molybdenum-binding subunit